ncbi:MAG: tetratricopeptide repeat protein [Thiobacillus sp.]
MKICHHVWSATLMLTMAFPAQAALDTTPDDIAMLPAYCDAKMGTRAPEAVSYWRTQMGHANWIHVHHYCGGLIELNRYYRGSTGRKKANLGNAVKEFSGMVNAFTPDFYLLPEAYLNRGKALKLMGKVGEAMSDFQKALEINPGLSQARIEMANVYAKSGNIQQALSVLKKGLEQASSSQSLRRRYQELGGDLKAIPDPSAITAAEPVKPVHSEIPSMPPPTSQEVEKPADVPVPEQKIGNKTNPWCRFCPDSEEKDPAKPKAD